MKWAFKQTAVKCGTAALLFLRMSSGLRADDIVIDQSQSYTNALSQASPIPNSLGINSNVIESGNKDFSSLSSLTASSSGSFIPDSSYIRGSAVGSFGNSGNTTYVSASVNSYANTSVNTFNDADARVYFSVAHDTSFTLVDSMLQSSTGSVNSYGWTFGVLADLENGGVGIVSFNNYGGADNSKPPQTFTGTLYAGHSYYLSISSYANSTDVSSFSTGVLTLTTGATNPSPVPEPSTSVLLFVGAICLVFRAHRGQ